jgi:hypothetical protein
VEPGQYAKHVGSALGDGVAIANPTVREGLVGRMEGLRWRG